MTYYGRFNQHANTVCYLKPPYNGGNILSTTEHPCCLTGGLRKTAPSADVPTAAHFQLPADDVIMAHSCIPFLPQGLAEVNLSLVSTGPQHLSPEEHPQVDITLTNDYLLPSSHTGFTEMIILNFMTSCLEIMTFFPHPQNISAFSTQ